MFMVDPPTVIRPLALDNSLDTPTPLQQPKVMGTYQDLMILSVLVSPFNGQLLHTHLR